MSSTDKIIETERLIIRELNLSDLESLRLLNTDPEDAHKLGDADLVFTDKELLGAYIKNQYGFFGYGIWGIILKTDGVLIGKAGLTNMPYEYDGPAVLELSYNIGGLYRGQGYAFESCRAILEYAKQELEVTECAARVDSGNTASLHLAEKLGVIIIAS